jgi:hypothetical protein
MGRIPRSDWDSIYDRARKGASKATLAEPYGVTSAAIGYVLKEVGKRRGHRRDTGPRVTAESLPQITVFDVPRTPPEPVKGRRRRPRAWEYENIYVPPGTRSKAATPKASESTKPALAAPAGRASKTKLPSAAPPATGPKPASVKGEKAAAPDYGGGNGQLRFGVEPKARKTARVPKRLAAPAPAAKGRHERRR